MCVCACVRVRQLCVKGETEGVRTDSSEHGKEVRAMSNRGGGEERKGAEAW